MSEQDVVAQLTGVLPRWPVSALVVEATVELLRLQRDIDVARSAGVLDAITDRLLEQAGRATDGLRHRTERLLAVGAMVAESGDPSEVTEAPAALRDDLDAESEHLSHLVEAIREARAGLAELTIGDAIGHEDVNRATRRFHALAQAARALKSF